MKIELDLSGFDQRELGNAGIVERLRKVEKTGTTTNHGQTRRIIGAIADQIEAQIPKPKPAEPTGLGAVVEDGEGRTWTRIPCGGDEHEESICWVRNGDDLADEWKSYSRLDVARVLHKGVQS